MDEKNLSSAAGDVLQKFRHSDEPDDETLHTRRVHVVAGATALVGTAAVVVGIGLVVVGLFSKPPAVSPVSGWAFFGGLATITAAKLTCLFDRGTLVGTRPIKTALMSDGIGWLGIGWIHVEPSRTPLGHMTTMGFVFSMAVFAFYWQEAAGSWRLKHRQQLMHSAMIAFLVATGIGILLMLSLSAKNAGESVDRLYLIVVFLATTGALALALILWFWGLVGITKTLLRGDAGRHAPPDEL
jgi:hypothetical protein